MRAVKEMFALKKLGFKIVLAYEGLGCSVERGYGSFWDQVIKMPSNTFKGEYYFRRLLPRSYKNILKCIIESNNFDIIHTYSMPDTLAVAAIRYSGLPVIFDVRDVLSGMDRFLMEDLKISFLNKVQELFYKVIIKKFEREANEKSDGRIYVSQEMLDYINQAYKIDLARTIVLPNYITRNNIPARKVQKISERDSGKHIVYIGNILFDEYKSTINTIKEIAAHSIHLHVYPVGDRTILRMTKDNFRSNPFVHFHNPLPIKQLLEEIQRYDFGLLPRPPDLNALNANFALPNKLFDYLAAGLPVAIRRTHAAANFIKTNRVGFIYNDIEELAGKVARSSGNYKIDIQKFIMENHIHHVVNLYDNISSNRR